MDEAIQVHFGKYSFPLLSFQIPKKTSLQLKQLNLMTLIEAADIRVAGNISLNISGAFTSDLFASKATAIVNQVHSNTCLTRKGIEGKLPLLEARIGFFLG